MDQLRFTIPEILSLLGVTQCVYILVYMMLRAGRLSRAGLPLVYFFVLGLGFLFDFAENLIGNSSDYYFYLQWIAWTLGPPLSVLLVIQISQIYKTPALKYYSVLLLPVLAFAVSALAMKGNPECQNLLLCAAMREWLTLSGFIAGCISMLAIWASRDLVTSITDRKTGKDRYWLILALVFSNIFFLGVMLLSLRVPESHEQFMLAHTILGLGLVYLAGTSLFRIYPQAVLVNAGNEKVEKLTLEEALIAKKVEELLTREKVYQESNYARTDLARECGASEAVISRIINLHFKKSFPQIINEYRVADAKLLLKQTEVAVKTVAEEVGFSSVASFNRVFREVTGETPSTYRKKVAG